MKTASLNILCLLSLVIVLLGGPPIASAAVEPAPVISAVSPNPVKNDLDTEVTITGNNFTNPTPDQKPEVWLNATKLDQVNVTSLTQLTARVPWGLNPGDYTLKVVNPDGQQGVYAQPFTILSGLGGWSSQPLNGGNVDEIVFSPGNNNVLYARVGNTGLFKSIDGGSNWTIIFLKNVQITGFAQDPQTAGLMFLSDAQWLFRSQDGGANWTEIEIPLNLWPNGSGVDMAIPHVNPATGRVLVSGFTFMPGSLLDGGVVCSDDHGTTWEACSSGLSGALIDPISFHPSNPNEILAGSKDGKIFRSLNGGDTWAELAEPLPDYNLTFLAHNPSDPAEIWVSGWKNGASNRTMRSIGTDYADIVNDWVEVKPAGSSTGLRLAFSPTTSGEILASGGAAFKSIDGGDTWTSYADSGQGVNSFAYHPSDSNIILAAVNRSGVLKTGNAQVSPVIWAASNQGLSGLVPQQLAVPVGRPDLVYALIPDWPGLFRYRQDLSGWEFLQGSHETDISGYPFAIDPFHPQVIFRGTLDESRKGRVNISSDGGLVWEAGALLPATTDYASCTIMPVIIRFDPVHPGWAVAGSRNDCGGWWFTEEGSLYQTKDAGASWQAAAMEGPMKHIVDIVYDAHDPAYLYASTRGSGLLRSSDSGATWEKIGEDMADLSDVSTMAAEPVPPYRIFAENLYTSDHGDTWQIGENLNGMNQIRFAGGRVSKLYAATNAGLMVSTDGAESWAPVSGPLSSVPVSSLDIVQIGERTILYAGTGGGLVATEPGAAFQNMAAGNAITSPGVYRLTTVERHIYLPIATR